MLPIFQVLSLIFFCALFKMATTYFYIIKNKNTNKNISKEKEGFNYSIQEDFHCLMKTASTDSLSSLSQTEEII